MSISCDRVVNVECVGLLEPCGQLMDGQVAEASLSRYGKSLCSRCELAHLRSFLDAGLFGVPDEA